jgi:hypothetical protein
MLALVLADGLSGRRAMKYFLAPVFGAVVAQPVTAQPNGRHVAPRALLPNMSGGGMMQPMGQMKRHELEQ